MDTQSDCRTITTIDSSHTPNSSAVWRQIVTFVKAAEMVASNLPNGWPQFATVFKDATVVVPLIPLQESEDAGNRMSVDKL